jgi:predicted lipoprotein with Yx(FWY)xxD motif
MRTSTIVWIIVIIVVILGGAYWWAASNSANNMPPATETSQAPMIPAGSSTESTGTGNAYAPGNLLLGTDATSTLGTYLVASNGMTLYTYANDTSGVSNCSGQCATNWPPYTVASTDVLANVQAGITGQVGTITRDDGTLQVTYNGMPLYFWANDKAPGDTNGQGVGNVWFVVQP